MERTRQWRRHKSDLYYLKRVKKILYHRNLFFGWNPYVTRVFNPSWFETIFLPETIMYKSIRTHKNTSRNKIKYGKSGRKTYGWTNSENTRSKQKIKFLKQLIYDTY